jgi:hypothetical protein
MWPGYAIDECQMANAQTADLPYAAWLWETRMPHGQCLKR